MGSDPSIGLLYSQYSDLTRFRVNAYVAALDTGAKSDIKMLVDVERDRRSIRGGG
jgi:hypothetical protein